MGCGCKDCKDVTLLAGNDGTGISAIVDNGNGTFTIFLDNGTSQTINIPDQGDIPLLRHNFFTLGPDFYSENGVGNGNQMLGRTDTYTAAGSGTTKIVATPLQGQIKTTPVLIDYSGATRLTPTETVVACGVPSPVDVISGNTLSLRGTFATNHSASVITINFNIYKIPCSNIGNSGANTDLDLLNVPTGYPLTLAGTSTLYTACVDFPISTISFNKGDLLFISYSYTNDGTVIADNEFIQVNATLSVKK